MFILILWNMAEIKGTQISSHGQDQLKLWAWNLSHHKISRVEFWDVVNIDQQSLLWEYDVCSNFYLQGLHEWYVLAKRLEGIFCSRKTCNVTSCAVHLRNLALRQIFAWPLGQWQTLTHGDGSKPWYLVNPKIAGKWMFIPLKMYL